MNAANDITRFVQDLAAHWAEPTLMILQSAGIRHVSVDMEIATWRTMNEVLHAELRWQRSFRYSTLVSLSTLMEQVLNKAAISVAQAFEPQSVSPEFANRVALLAGERRSTSEERALYLAIVRRPAMKAAFKEPSRTDFTPRLRASALRG